MEPVAVRTRVLVVEDNDLSAEIISHVLAAQCGFEVELAPDAAQALCLVRSRHYDMALVDLELPDMPGNLLMAVIRDAAPSMRLVACTAHDHDSPVVAPAGAVADAILFKQELVRSLPMLKGLMAPQPAQPRT